MSKKKINIARQGEVLFFRDDNLYSWGTSPVKDNVIREGEKSGHKHEVKGDGQLSMFGDQMILDVGDKGAEVVHPEHDPIKFKKGRYKVGIQREFDGMKQRKAKD